jgi:hypothetical protein
VTKQELYLHQLPLVVVAFRLDVQKLEVAASNVVGHEDQRVLVEDASELAVRLAVLLDALIVDWNFVGLAMFYVH